MISTPGHITLWSKRFLLVVLLGVLASGCNGEQDLGEETLARVGSTSLRRKDLSRFLPTQWPSAEDSLRATRQWIDRWIAEQVLTEQALGEIDGLESRIEYKVKDYRNRLILNEYYDYLLNTRLDTVVDSASFYGYLSKHEEKYRAQEPYFQAVYLGTYQVDIRKPMQVLSNGNKSTDWNALKLWGQENAFMHQTDSAVWLSAEDVDALSASLNYYGRLRDLRPGHYPVSWTGKYDGKPAQYMFRVNQMVSPGQPIPESMLRESVRQGIIHERSRNILEAEKIRLVREATEKGDVYVP